MAIALKVACAVAVLGVLFRMLVYWRAPQPQTVVLTPAPANAAGVMVRIALEALIFRSLWRADKLGWLLGITFHYSLAVVVLRHHWLFFESSFSWLHMFDRAQFAPHALAASLLALLIRRIWSARLRYISSLSDYLWPALLLAIAASGMLMWSVGSHDVLAVRSFSLRVWALSSLPMPAHPVLAAHIGCVVLVLCLFPFSKMLHAPGILMSPTRTSPDRVRRREEAGS